MAGVRALVDGQLSRPEGERVGLVTISRDAFIQRRDSFTPSHTRVWASPPGMVGAVSPHTAIHGTSAMLTSSTIWESCMPAHTSTRPTSRTWPETGQGRGLIRLPPITWCWAT
jgi:hypothetical protein